MERGGQPMVIVDVSEPTAEVVAAVQRLVPQLGFTGHLPDAPTLATILASDATCLLLARMPDADGPVVGMLTLASYRIPTGLKVWIEDVVVDGSARGQGVGAALVRAALARARAMGATQIDLTSAPWRAAANRLYRRLGFVQRETNVYRYTLVPD